MQCELWWWLFWKLAEGAYLSTVSWHFLLITVSIQPTVFMYVCTRPIPVGRFKLLAGLLSNWLIKLQHAVSLESAKYKRSILVCFGGGDRKTNLSQMTTYMRHIRTLPTQLQEHLGIYHYMMHLVELRRYVYSRSRMAKAKSRKSSTIITRHADGQPHHSLSLGTILPVFRVARLSWRMAA